MGLPSSIPAPACAPKVALVVPCYGYAHFFPEFAASVVAQSGTLPFICLIVDDCDGEPGASDLYGTYAAAYPSTFRYLRLRKNRGLASARNVGVEHVMQAFPSVEVVAFPDPDDRLLPRYVEKTYHAFMRCAIEARAVGDRCGWAFEDPTMFGMNGSMRRIRSYSRLWNMAGATQMPSSALSVGMYREGLRYDPAFRWGGEDWAFSLTAVEKGYVGRYGGRQGYRWRRRPGSMSASAAQERNRTAIRHMHPQLFTAKAVIAAAAAENQHFALVTGEAIALAATPEVSRRAVLQGGGEIDHRHLARILNDTSATPANPCPQTFVFAAAVALRLLARSPLWPSFVWVADMLAGADFAVSHRLVPHEEVAGGASPSVSWSGGDTDADIITMSVGSVRKVLERDGPGPGEILTIHWPIKGPRPAVPSVRQIVDHFTTSLRSTAIRWFALRRHGDETWKPQGLTWRTLPSFHLGIRALLAAPENEDRDLLVCSSAALARVLEALDRGTLGDVCLLVLGRVEERHAVSLDRLLAHRRVSFVLLSDTFRQVREASPTGLDLSFEDAVCAYCVTFRRTIFWSTLELSPLLAPLKALGRRREIVFGDARGVREVLGAGLSSFKAFDRYRVLDGASGGLAALQAFGVPDELAAPGPAADDFGEPAMNGVT